VLVLYTVDSGDWALWRRLYIGSGLILFLIMCRAVVRPGPGQEPRVPEFLFIVQQFERYLTPTDRTVRVVLITSCRC